MDRDLDEVVASQSSMLQRLDRQGSSLDQQQLKPLLQQQLSRAVGPLPGPSAAPAGGEAP